jgi:hypothetical protein
MPKDEDFNFDLIAHYFINRDNSGAFQVVNNQIINDIDFCELFAFIDRTHSKIGQQYLFNQLLAIGAHTNFEEQEQLINHFLENDGVKTKVQTLLSKLNKRESHYISALFLDGYIPKPKWFRWIKVLLALTVIALVFTFIFHEIFILLFLLFITNLSIYIWNKKNILTYIDSIPQLPLLCKIAGELTQLNLISKSNDSILASIASINELKSKIFYFKFEKKTDSEFAGLILFFRELIKILFLSEPLVVFETLEKLDKKRKDIQNLFEYIGKVDSALSVAAIRNSVGNYCIPTAVSTGKILEFTDIYHPLIPNCITNSMTIKDRSILLTGSNMSGKTTFIRTIAINLLLAQTINTCLAKDFKFSPTRLFSAIRISDDLLNDKSYYFEEVATIKNMIDESHSSCNNLFLLDEIFKGTNTIERIAAGKAVLSYLAKSENNLVFVSTHDIELTDLLIDEYDLYHFTEIIQDGQIHFDYKLKAGNLSTKNAIRILEINDYPPEVIQEARGISIFLLPLFRTS